jgi:hypothetical protein
VVNLQALGGSKALVIAAIWTGIFHILLGILGTFVLKRFPTSFSVGFFLGVLIVLANQNLILFGTFHGYRFGTPRTNGAFANLGLTLFAVLSFFSILLFHFKQDIIVASIDTAASSNSNKGNNNNSNVGQSSEQDESTTEYHEYDEQAF